MQRYVSTNPLLFVVCILSHPSPWGRRLVRGVRDRYLPRGDGGTLGALRVRGVRLTHQHHTVKLPPFNLKSELRQIHSHGSSHSLEGVRNTHVSHTHTQQRNALRKSVCSSRRRWISLHVSFPPPVFFLFVDISLPFFPDWSE